MDLFTVCLIIINQPQKAFIGYFVAVSFCTCFASFVFCYTFWTDISFRRNGQMRSLSGVMKNACCKPFFCFAMSCLGGSLFLALVIRSLINEGEEERCRLLLLLCGSSNGSSSSSSNNNNSLKQENVRLLSLGMYVCLLGLVNYDKTYSKKIHLTFVLALILIGYAFSNFIILEMKLTTKTTAAAKNHHHHYHPPEEDNNNNTMKNIIIIIITNNNNNNHNRSRNNYDDDAKITKNEDDNNNNNVTKTTTTTTTTTESWGSIASKIYNVFTSIFVLVFLYNFYLHTQCLDDYHTIQTWFEILWVLSLVFMLCVYAFFFDDASLLCHH